jgi:hypothetical protein
MSETLKRIKSCKKTHIFQYLFSIRSINFKITKADTPWIKSSPEKAAKPSKSSIMKNRVKTGSFLRSSISENDLRNTSSSQNDFNSDKSDKEKTRLRLSLMRTSTGLYNDSTFGKKSLSGLPFKLKRFAQDLLSDYVNKAVQNAEFGSNLKPGIALSCLNLLKRY